MNKYQREKSKRMKKLSAIGMPYYKQKKFIKIFKGDFVKFDEAIAQMEKLKKEVSPLGNIIKSITNSLYGLFRKDRRDK